MVDGKVMGMQETNHPATALAANAGLLPGAERPLQQLQRAQRARVVTQAIEWATICLFPAYPAAPTE